ncbi:MAG: allantoate amidohydrolase [Marmoricola sp.]|nr:allantoate amidohydrolase [Marmoricola sp.]
MGQSMTDGFEQMWRDLAPLGRSAASGGYFRQPYTAVDGEVRTWFLEQCAARGLEVEADGNGNLVAWWMLGPLQGATEGAGRSGPSGVLIGSHLDSVLDGGAYDGPLGVVSSLAAVDLLRERGVVPSRPIAVGAFAEEEGSRFGIACLGSRLASGSTTPAQAAGLRDREGVPLLDAMAAAGVEPSLGRAAWLDRVGCFVELHVEQGRDLVDRGVPVGLATAIWPHGRYRFDFTGEANHAGTTRMADRHDPMLTFAMTAMAAGRQAELTGQRATFGRLDVAPNGTNAIASRVTAWLDARAASEAELVRLVAEIEGQGAERADRDGTRLQVTAESVSGEVAFDAALTAELSAGLADRWGPVPAIPTMAGHDAGILAAAGVPTAMMFVRNPTGVSHSPAEYAEPADCLAGTEALADALEVLVS